LIFLNQSYLYGGGFKFYSGGNYNGLHVENSFQESGYSPPVWLASCVGDFNASINHVVVADQATGFSGVRADCASYFAGNIVVQDIGPTTSVDGPATILGGYPGSQPLLSGQVGFINGYSFGQTNFSRRQFGPVIARFPNIVQNAVSWTPENTSVTSGIAAPDGTTGAYQITSSSSGFEWLYLNHAFRLSPGQILISGAWVQSPHGGGYQGSYTMPCELTITGAKTTLAWMLSGGSPFTANGEWDWCWNAEKISSTSASSVVLNFTVSASSTHPTNVYAPVLISIPAGTLTDSEAAELIETLQSYRSDATAGQVSLLPGEQFKADSIQVGNGPIITSGLGPPKGQASPGSIYLRRDGVAGSTFYIYEKDGWKAQF